MTQQRFFVSPEHIHDGRVTLSGDQAHQIFNVLRLRNAQTVMVLDNQGWQYEVALKKVTRNSVTGEIISREKARGEPASRLTLFQAVLKKDNFEWVLQKGTELGVARFVPVVTQRTLVREEAIRPSKRQRWQRIVSEAAEQSGRGLLPLISEPLNLSDALAEAAGNEIALIPYEREIDAGARMVLAQLAAVPAPKSVALFIGPEGGYSEEEIAEARAAGVQPLSLGPRILRAETAAVVACALTLSALGEVG